MANHDTMPLIKSATVMPPTTPPAIAPLFELLLGGEFDGDDDTDEVVEVGVIEAVPVTSGASDIEPKIRKLWGLIGKVTHRQQAARPLNSSYRRAVGELRSDQLWKKE